MHLSSAQGPSHARRFFLRSGLSLAASSKGSATCRKLAERVAAISLRGTRSQKRTFCMGFHWLTYSQRRTELVFLSQQSEVSFMQPIQSARFWLPFPDVQSKMPDVYGFRPLPLRSRTNDAVCLLSGGRQEKASGLVSRVLSGTAIYLERESPRASSTQPERTAGHRMALLFALAPDGVCQAATLPPRWCALTAPFQLFSCVAHTARTACSEQGSLLFCGTFRRVAPPSR